MSGVNTSDGSTSASVANAPDTNIENNRKAPASNTRSRFEKKRNNNINSANPITYEGECAAVGAVLALKFEKFHKKIPYEQFVDKINQYVLGNYKDGSDIKCLLKKLEDPMDTLKKYLPEDIDENASAVEKEIQKEEIKQYVARKTNLRRNIEKVFGLIWGQCSSSLQAYIKGLSEYEEKCDVFDVAWLLRELRKASSGIDNKMNPYITLHEAMANVYRMKQGADESNDAYLERFNMIVCTAEMVGGKNLFYSEKIAKKDLHAASQSDITAAEEQSKAILLLKNADDKRYRVLKDDLKMGTYLSRDEYPITTASMYELMVKTSGGLDPRSTNRNKNNSTNQNYANTGTILTQRKAETTGDSDEDEIVPGTDGVTHNVTCYNCKKRGHYASNCPEPDMRRTGVGALQLCTCFAQSTTPDQNSEEIIDSNWLLLDSCSTDNVCNNINMLTNVRNCDENEKLRVVTNGGELSYDQIGDLKLLPIQAYYNENSIANIVSLKQVGDIPGVKITMNSADEKSIRVHYKNKELKFSEGEEGLYHLNVEEYFKNKCKPINYNKKVNDYGSHFNFLNSVNENKLGYTKSQINLAERARNLQRCLGWPSDDALKNYLNNNLIINCKISPMDVDRANMIFGKAEPLLRGKKTAPQAIRHDTQC